ncbi:unnamed protein product, partial [Oppiella nova]
TGDSCLIVKSRAKHHAISTKLDKVFKFNNKPLVLQYEVQFRNGQECGGAYIKLLSHPSGDLKRLNDKSQYSIMFGPDKCGNDMKLHFIFQHKNPNNGSLSEKHWKLTSNVNKIDEVVFKDSRWHLIRLEINTDNTFEVTLDKSSVGKGSLLEDFNPPVNPPKYIDDPNDSKPEDWDEREKIPDPDAVKPEDWDESEPRKISDPKAAKPSDWAEDEPEMVADADAKQPSDWDTEMDGEWEAPLIANPRCAQLSGCGKWTAPLIDNPKFKGKWRAPLIGNPAYKGKWGPRKVPNPDFYEDPDPFRTLLPIDAVAFELWTISDGIAFDNVLITDDSDVGRHIAALTYQIKKEMSDSETDNILIKAVKYTNKYPWLWAVYIMAVGIPVVLFIAFCCVSPTKRTDTSDASATPTIFGQPYKLGEWADYALSHRKLYTNKTTEECGRTFARGRYYLVTGLVDHYRNAWTSLCQFTQLFDEVTKDEKQFLRTGLQRIDCNHTFGDYFDRNHTNYTQFY